jgi:hypothetical protein
VPSPPPKGKNPLQGQSACLPATGLLAVVPCVAVAGERGQRHAGHYLLLAPVPKGVLEGGGKRGKGAKGREGGPPPWWWSLSSPVGRRPRGAQPPSSRCSGASETESGSGRMGLGFQTGHFDPARRVLDRRISPDDQ